jgi:hypothetical protein
MKTFKLMRSFIVERKEDDAMVVGKGVKGYEGNFPRTYVGERK